MAPDTPITVEQPTEGGSYLLDPATGKLTKVAGTEPRSIEQHTQAKQAALDAGTPPAQAEAKE